MNLIKIAASLLLALALPVLAFAEGFPDHPVRFICPLPPGGDVDFVTRVLAAKLSEIWGQPVIVDNRAGASGTIGASAVATAAPDGYTLLMGGVGNLVMGHMLYKQLPYDGIKAFAPISLVGGTPMVLAVRPSLAAISLQQFIQFAKDHPGKLTYASAGIGSTIQLPMELLKSQAGVELVHVPYKGAAPAITDLLGGQVDSMFAGIPALRAHIKDGKVRALAVTSARRSPDLADLPTVAESGLPGFEVMFWFAVVAPAGTPQPVIERINADVTRALRSADVVKKLNDAGVEVYASTPGELAAFLKDEDAKWSKVVRDGRIAAE